MRLTLLPFAVLLGAVGSCSFLTTDRVCTDEFRFGLNVGVRDSVTGAAAASGATLIAVDHTGAIDSTVFPPNRPEFDPRPLTGAGEHAGIFRVTVRKPGYRDWVRSGVRVTRDACHVQPTTLTALLQR